MTLLHLCIYCPCSQSSLSVCLFVPPVCNFACIFSVLDDYTLCVCVTVEDMLKAKRVEQVSVRPRSQGKPLLSLLESSRRCLNLTCKCTIRNVCHCSSSQS